VGVLGATSFVGSRLLPMLTQAGWQVMAFSRSALPTSVDGVKWRCVPTSKVFSPLTGMSFVDAPNNESHARFPHPRPLSRRARGGSRVAGATFTLTALPEGEGNLPYWVCVAPIWVLPEYFSLLEAEGARRVVALSSTSRFTKNDSSDPAEQALALRFVEAEARLQAWAERHGIEWVVLLLTRAEY